MSVPVKAKASERVRRVLGIDGYGPLCDGLAAVSWFRFRHRAGDVDEYRIVNLHAGERHVQVSISPTGRSVRVYVDGVEVR